MNDPIGRLDVVAFDCPDPTALAEFYRSLIGGEVVEHEAGGWVELHSPGGRLAFQYIEAYRSPTWPDGDVPQQAHLDVRVADLDAAEPRAIEFGARKARFQPEPDAFRVFFDPAGHPFCLVLPWHDELDA